MDSDDFFGPARVINAVRQQIEIMQHLRQSWRDRGVYLTWQARAYASGPGPRAGRRPRPASARCACETGSARIIAELARLDDSLAHWRVVPQVGEFRAALTEVIPHRRDQEEETTT